MHIPIQIGSIDTATHNTATQSTACTCPCDLLNTVIKCLFLRSILRHTTAGFTHIKLYRPVKIAVSSHNHGIGKNVGNFGCHFFGGFHTALLQSFRQQSFYAGHISLLQQTFDAILFENSLRRTCCKTAHSRLRCGTAIFQNLFCSLRCCSTSQQISSCRSRKHNCGSTVTHAHRSIIKESRHILSADFPVGAAFDVFAHATANVSDKIGYIHIIGIDRPPVIFAAETVLNLLPYHCQIINPLRRRGADRCQRGKDTMFVGELPILRFFCSSVVFVLLSLLVISHSVKIETRILQLRRICINFRINQSLQLQIISGTVFFFQIIQILILRGLQIL